MSSIQNVHASGAAGLAPVAPPAEGAVSAPLLLLLATTAGLLVASLYYSQPMLGVLGPDMQADSRVVGLVPTLTQLGYALGILLLAPLGDRFDRRRIIVIKSIALMLALLLSGLAPGMGALLAASLAVGLAATVAQDVVPAAATLAPAAQRGRIGQDSPHQGLAFTETGAAPIEAIDSGAIDERQPMRERRFDACPRGLDVGTDEAPQAVGDRAHGEGRTPEAALGGGLRQRDQAIHRLSPSGGPGAGLESTTDSSGGDKVMAQVRIGVIATGMMGCEHIANLKEMPEAAIVAIADPTPASLDWARLALGDRATGVAAHADARDLLADPRIDAVVIASPNHTHADVLEAAFRTGKHILCEKPLCTTLDDAARVRDRAARHPAVFWVGMEYRYMPPVTAFIAELHAGRIGPLRMLASREHRFPFLKKVGDWNRFAANTGGTMVEKCCHFFDLMRFIVRSEPVRVYCSGAQNVNHLDERYNGVTPDIVDNSFTTVDFADGTRALLDLCMFADGAEEQEEIVATGDIARLDVSIPGSVLTRAPRTGFGNPKAPEKRHIEVDAAALAAGSHHGSTFYQHQAFARAVRGQGPVEVTAEDGLKAVAIGMAAEISLREHRVVDMAELLGQSASA